MVTEIVPVRAVDLSIGPFCTEFRCERFCDDDAFWYRGREIDRWVREIDRRVREIDRRGREIDRRVWEIDRRGREIDRRGREIDRRDWEIARIRSILPKQVYLFQTGIGISLYLLGLRTTMLN